MRTDVFEYVHRSCSEVHRAIVRSLTKSPQSSFAAAGYSANSAATALSIVASSLAGSTSIGSSMRNCSSRCRLSGSSSATTRVPTEYCGSLPSESGFAFTFTSVPAQRVVGHQHIDRTGRGFCHTEAAELTVHRGDHAGIDPLVGGGLSRRPGVRLELRIIQMLVRRHLDAVLRHRDLARRRRREASTENDGYGESLHIQVNRADGSPWPRALGRDAMGDAAGILHGNVCRHRSRRIPEDFPLEPRMEPERSNRPSQDAECCRIARRDPLEEP